jgi:hypothetical protein
MRGVQLVPEFTIGVAADRPQAPLESLADWLRFDGTGNCTVSEERQSPVPGALGSALDAVTVAVGAGGSLSVLAAAIRAWASQPKNSSIRIRVTTSEEQVSSIEIDADRVTVDDFERILRAAKGLEP